MRRLALLALVPALPAPLFAGVVYVDAAATGANTGTSWLDAHTSLRVALDAAVAGDELWIAQGTYVPGPTASEADSFFLKDGVALYGGFAGGETALAQRDPVARPTVLSGDVNGDDILSPWPSGWNIVTSNSAHVVTAIGVGPTAVLDGLVISQGHTGPSGTFAGAPEMRGSGLLNLGASPTVRDCVFQYNVAAWAWGAAIYNGDSSPEITGCTFRYNAVHLACGAGIGNIGDSSPVIRDCLFTNNQATTASGGQEAQGCAIACYWDVPPITVEGCTFRYNEAKQFYASGAGFEQARGGGISSFTDGLTVKDCVFEHNSANAGGAIFTWGDATIVDCVFRENAVYNMISTGVTISGYGSAIGVFTGYYASTADEVRVVNCSVVDNHVVNGESGAVAAGGVGLLRLENSVLWGNTAPPPASPRQVHYKGAVQLSHCCVENLFVPDANDPVPQPSEIPGCIDADPLFANRAGGDLRLTLGSPCVDAGATALVPGLATTDLDGNDRVAFGATSFDVDLGPYEFGSSAPAACPSLVVSPASQAVTEGLPVTFEVLAQGVDLVYQWRKDGGALPGATAPSLTLPAVTPSDAGAYDVVVSNGCGSLASAIATLTVTAQPLGDVVCSGDGTDPGCPCGNDKDFGSGCENSTGEGAALSGAGSRSVSAGTAVLTCTHLPANQNGIYFMGTNLLNGGVGLAFGDGLRCTNAIKRFSVQNAGPQGVMTLANPAALAPAEIGAGATRLFQVWFRDPSGPCGTGWNTSNAYRITFEP
ncbi:MAG: right-handed parallel beta-helix repeat-containing protein [Planctomycetes bacterium]|nr:right-handed parallel beta-helix repeat-containing protein [Planctomycetota bacterium]